MADTEKNRRQLISRVTGEIEATYVRPDGFVENGAFYSRQQPQRGEYLPLVYCVYRKKAEYMAGHENEPLYKWTQYPADKGLMIHFKDAE